MTMSDSQLASLSRQLGANDPQMVATTSGGGLGKKSDRNVELLLKDPRTLWKTKALPAKTKTLPANG